MGAEVESEVKEVLNLLPVRVGEVAHLLVVAKAVRLEREERRRRRRVRRGLQKGAVKSRVSGGRFDLVWLPARVPRVGPQHVRGPKETKKNTHPKQVTALFGHLLVLRCTSRCGAVDGHLELEVGLEDAEVGPRLLVRQHVHLLNRHLQARNETKQREWSAYATPSTTWKHKTIHPHRPAYTIPSESIFKRCLSVSGFAVREKNIRHILAG